MSAFNEAFTSRGFTAPKWSHCPEGWMPQLEACLTSLAATGAKVTFIQVKVKFGELRVYYKCEGSAEQKQAVTSLIDALEHALLTTCEECSKPAIAVFDKQRPEKWDFYITLCQEHGEAEVARREASWAKFRADSL